MLDELDQRETVVSSVRFGGILLAAGLGRRFREAYQGPGQVDKLLQRLPDHGNDERVAERAARNLLAAGLGRNVAIVRDVSGELAQRLAATGIEVLVCADAASGMGHSLAAGVEALRESAGWIIALADMPYVLPESIRLVSRELARGDAQTIVAPVWQGRKGHPVGFGSAWSGRLRALQGDQGARGVIRHAGSCFRTVCVDDPGVLHDVDVPTDIT